MDFKKLIEKQEYDFLRTDEHLRDKTILLGLGGSYAYGTNIEDSDVDIRGICLNATSELIGLQDDFEQVEDRNTDTVIYSLKKIVPLLMRSNPNTIELLGLRPQDYILIHPAGQLILDNKRLFLSKIASNTFGGYAKSQLNRLVNRSGRAADMILENEQRSIDKAFMTFASRHKGYIKDTGMTKISDGRLVISMRLENMPMEDVANVLNEINSIDRNYRKSVRNDKATTHGKLAKHMMHLIRLYMMGIDILKDGEIITCREGDDHKLLMSIRNGDYLADDGITPTVDFYEILTEYETRFDEALSVSALPDAPDAVKISGIVEKINMKYVLS